MGSRRVSFVPRWPIWPVGLAVFGVLSLLVAIRAAAASTSNYGSVSTLALGVSLCAGAILIAVAAVLSNMARGRLTGILCSAIGVAWLAAEMVGWSGGPSAVRSAAMAIEVMVLPLLAHLGLSFPRSSIEGRLDRSVLAVAYGAAVFTGVSRALVYDPFRDLHCWRNCTDNVFLLFPEAALARILWDAWLVFLAFGGVVLAARVGLRLISASAAARRWSWYVLVPAATGIALEAARAGLLIVDEAEDPRVGPFMTVFVGRGLTLIALGLGVGWGIWKMNMVSRSLANLTEQLGDATTGESLEEILARSLGDDTVEVLYWQPDLNRFVDANGSAAVPARAADRIATSIERGGHVLGVVTHNNEIEPTDLQREFGSAARLAIDNERLRAGLLAQVEELRESQQRIVDTADSFRRRIERDLHDGAQQRLLALSYDVRLAQAAAVDDPQAAAALGNAVEKITLALSDLRQLAHGIFPTVLVDSGLGPAVIYLSEGSETPVQVFADIDRCPPAVEMAGYVVVSEALAAAARMAEEQVRIAIHQSNDHLAVEIGFAGEAPTSHDLTVAIDRVGALGGTVELVDGMVRAVIPCGS